MDSTEPRKCIAITPAAKPIHTGCRRSR